MTPSDMPEGVYHTSRVVRRFLVDRLVRRGQLPGNAFDLAGQCVQASLLLALSLPWYHGINDVRLVAGVTRDTQGRPGDWGYSIPNHVWAKVRVGGRWWFLDLTLTQFDDVGPVVWLPYREALRRYNLWSRESYTVHDPSLTDEEWAEFRRRMEDH